MVVELKNPPVQGSAFRVGPATLGRQAAFLWKFWITGNEVYASNRHGGHLVKISMHESGQIHMHQGRGGPQVLARPLPMDGGTWGHALEVRFLLSESAGWPPIEDTKRKKAYLIEVPADHYLLLNVLIARSSDVAPECLPSGLLPAAQPIWSALLRGGRPVVLTARLFKLDDVNREAIRYIRYEVIPHATFSNESNTPPYLEVRNAHWSAEGGNVVLIVPMGK
jgi:hypothetical protein